MSKRAKKYAEKLDSSVASARVVALGPRMIQQSNISQAQLETLDREVKKIIEGQTTPVYGIQVPAFLAFARQLFKAKNQFSGSTLNSEAEILYLKWSFKGLDKTLLKEIGAYFGFTFTDLAPPSPPCSCACILGSVYNQGIVGNTEDPKTLLYDEYAQNAVLTAFNYYVQPEAPGPGTIWALFCVADDQTIGSDYKVTCDDVDMELIANFGEHSWPPLATRAKLYRVEGSAPRASRSFKLVQTNNVTAHVYLARLQVFDIYPKNMGT